MSVRIRAERNEWYQKAVRLMAHSYPHPDLSRRYGDVFIAGRLADAYSSHVRLLIDAFHLSNDHSQEFLSAFLVLLLHTQPPGSSAELVEIIVQRLDKRPHFWFMAVNFHFTQLCDKYESQKNPRDFFRDLSEFNYAGITWGEQLARLNLVADGEPQQFVSSASASTGETTSQPTIACAAHEPMRCPTTGGSIPLSSHSSKRPARSASRLPLQSLWNRTQSLGPSRSEHHSRVESPNISSMTRLIRPLASNDGGRLTLRLISGIIGQIGKIAFRRLCSDTNW